MKSVINFTRILSILAAAAALNACALLGSDEDPIKKNKNIQFDAPAGNFKKVDIGSADSTWQSSSTGNTIAVNSTCRPLKQGVDLDTLGKSLIAGVEHSTVKSEKDMKLDGLNAKRIVVEGRTDGVPVTVDVVTFRKSDCTFDLVYVARSSAFESERPAFEKFIERFHVP